MATILKGKRIAVGRRVVSEYRYTNIGIELSTP